ncbi:DNA repair protein [filamentous cyanobacterium CCP5]|nr:DNA repair protein [filamentous cyanobacterium CCP5]
MGFPVPGDAFEQSLDLNQYLIQNPASTFFMGVDGEVETSEDVQLGDLLVVDRSRLAKDGALVVAAIAGIFHVVRVNTRQGRLLPADWDLQTDTQFEIWGIVTSIIRRL